MKPTQAEIAAATGVDPSYYSRLEAGSTTANPALALSIAGLLNVEVAEIFNPATYLSEPVEEET